MQNSTASLPQSLPKLITITSKTQRLWNNLSADPICLWNNLEIMLTHLSAVPDFLDLSSGKETQTTIVQIHGNSHQLIRIHCLDETLVWLFGKSSERISANAQLARKRNSYANFVQNQSKNREWIRTTKTAWSESTETATANQTLLVPANMYIIQLHTWECVLLNKLVQTLCLWNNLCIIDCIAGVTLLDHLLWKHRSLESCVHLSTFQVDVLYVWL